MLFKNIKLIIYDFDGVMTDNRVMVDEKGVESVFVNRSDGLAIDMLRKSKKYQAIISTETNRVAAARAKKLRLPVFYGISDKLEAMKKLCRRYRCAAKDVLYVGNDINDLDAMRAAGHRAAPSDAHPSIKRIADIVTRKKGGEGVIRELADRIIS